MHSKILCFCHSTVVRVHSVRTKPTDGRRGRAVVLQAILAYLPTAEEKDLQRQPWKQNGPQHLETRDTKAWLAVTAANLKVVKVLAGSGGRVMDSWIPSADQGVKMLWKMQSSP